MRDEQVPHDGLERLGVRRDVCSGLTVGTITQASATLRRVAAVAADDADDRRADALGVARARATRFGLMFFSRLAAADRQHEHRRRRRVSRLPCSHSTNTVAQPSSLVRAVSSETLSVGAYASMPAIFRKSLTACEAFAGAAADAQEEQPASRSRAPRRAIRPCARSRRRRAGEDLRRPRRRCCVA